MTTMSIPHIPLLPLFTRFKAIHFYRKFWRLTGLCKAFANDRKRSFFQPRWTLLKWLKILTRQKRFLSPCYFSCTKYLIYFCCLVGEQLSVTTSIQLGSNFIFSDSKYIDREIARITTIVLYISRLRISLDTFLVFRMYDIGLFPVLYLRTYNLNMLNMM